MHLSLKRTSLILLLATVILVATFTPVRAAINEIVWRQFFNETGFAARVAVDGNGNVIVADNTVDGYTSVIKHSGGGRELWRVDASLGAYTSVQDLAVDKDGYIYVVGRISGSERSAYISKYGPKGGHHWWRGFPENPNAQITGVAVGPGGNIYVVGWAWGKLPNMARSSSRGSDAFIRKYNPDGKIHWTRQFSINDFKDGTRAFDVSVGPGGGVYVVGFDELGSFRTRDGLFLRKYSPRGGIYWTRRVSRREPYYASEGSIAVDKIGAVTIIGRDMMHPFAVKYSHKGKRLWTRQLEGHMPPMGVTVDRDRNIYVIGQKNTIGTVYARKYSPDGSLRWTRHFVSGWPTDAAADSANNLYVTGVAFKEDPYPSFLAKFRR